jgi:hypothetical protein
MVAKVTAPASMAPRAIFFGVKSAFNEITPLLLSKISVFFKE